VDVFLHPFFVMRLSALVFLSLNILMLVASTVFNAGHVFEYGTSIGLIALVGIPHGAIDHVLFLKNNKAKTHHFYLMYFLLMAIFVAVWLIHPISGLLAFLILSAYHFGQSQFSKYKALPRLLRFSIYVSWGSSILAGLVVYNKAEILQLCERSEDLRVFSGIFASDWMMVGLLLSSLAALVFIFKSRTQLTLKTLFLELAIFGLIHLTFYVQSLLVGFAIYFATLHSLDVLKQEYLFLKQKVEEFNLTQFVLLLLPYTVLSLLGISLLFGLSHFNMIPLSIISVAFIFIAALTLPHSLVMENFYTKRFQNPIKGLAFRK
jgi:Brp/Blh family beta-carotene 15,15'-monooxygenase